MLWIWQALMTAARMVGGPTTIEEMDGELSKVIEDFMRAVDVEAFRLAKKSGKYSLSQFGDNAFLVTSCRPKRARASGARAFDSTTKTC